MRTKRCKSCRNTFTPSKPLQCCCSIECAIVYGQKKTLAKEKLKQAEARNEVRRRKEALKTRSDYIKEAQIAFNSYIRERDKDKPCICCGLPLGSDSVGGGFDCGHYRSVGSAPHLRFDERNAHGQRKQCNRYGAGRAVDYRLGLIARIGLPSVESLESDQAERKWSIEELKAIKATYTRKRKELKG